MEKDVKERMDWLEMVSELERRMGAPMFSDSTKLQVASGIPPAEIEQEMERIYQRRVGDTSAVESR